MPVLVSINLHLISIPIPLYGCIVDSIFPILSIYSLPDISKEKWERLMASNGWNTVELRDNRYNQIVHMVSAANGAEDFYSTEVSFLNIFYFLFDLITTSFA